MDLSSPIVLLLILIFSAVVHEVWHGLAAERLGDPTARLAGRLTLNPLPHIDPFGSILLPLMLLTLNSPVVFGAAKPVPVNYFNLRSPKRDMSLVALAGPAANFSIALLCALPLRFGIIGHASAGGQFLLQVVVINVVLAVFNLVPIPPLDGSKALAGILPDRYITALFSLERFGFVLVFLFIFSGLFQKIFIPILNFFLQVFAGISLF